MAETLSTLSIISFVVAGVAFVVAIFLWIIFHIPKVISDLSGRTARKSIARMRATNEKSGDKSYRPSKTNADRGKLTGNMPDSTDLGTTEQMPTQKEAKSFETGLLNENMAGSRHEESTGLLSDSDATELLESNVTELLDENAVSVKRIGGKKLTMLDEVMLIHTEEVIE